MQIYTTGAFLSPEYIVQENGMGFWVWVVDEFDSDAPNFMDGDEIGPEAVADTEAGLLPNDEEEDE